MEEESKDLKPGRPIEPSASNAEAEIVTATAATARYEKWLTLTQRMDTKSDAKNN